MTSVGNETATTGPTSDDGDHRLPAHRAVVDELLSWGAPRPEVAPDLVEAVQDRLWAGLEPVAAELDDSLWLSKASLRALDCDGRWLDQQESTFTPTLRMLAGTITHRAAELDHASGRQVEIEDLVERAMQDVGANPTRRDAEVLNGLDPLDRADLRATGRDGLVEWRRLWPDLDQVEVTFEHRLRAQVGTGPRGVVLSGQPDLVVRSPRPRAGRATDLVVDLKTGRRNETGDRADLRFYALLWTLKYRRPPFRWATFYLAEGRWVHEDFTPALLLGAVDRVVDGATRAARLRAGVAESELQLNPGGHCSFCGRRATCPVAPVSW